MKKRHLFILSIFLFLLASCQQEKVIKESFYPNGNIKEQIILQNEPQQQLISKNFYENGSLSCFYHLSDSSFVKDGKSFCLHENGDTLSIATFHKGELVGVRRAYHSNGTMASFENRKRNKVSEFLVYREDGTLEEYIISYEGKYFFRVEYDEQGKVYLGYGDPYFFIQLKDSLVTPQTQRMFVLTGNEPGISRKIVAVIEAQLNGRFVHMDSVFNTVDIQQLDNTSTMINFDILQQGNYEVKLVSDILVDSIQTTYKDTIRMNFHFPLP